MTEANKRLISALVGIAIVSLIIILGGKFKFFIFVFSILTFIAAIICILEYFHMVFLEQKIQKIIGIVLGISLSFILILQLANYLFELATIIILTIFISYLLLAPTYKELNQVLTHLGLTILGIFYISVLLSYLPLIRGLTNGTHWIFLVFLISWSTDTAAYFIGTKWGKNKLYFLISPGKTIEGAIGGVFAAVTITLIYKYLFFHQLHLIEALFIPIVGSSLSQLGDLLESLLKRGLLVKDSSQLIPGHGGLLDRLDGVMVVSPFIYLYASIIS